MSSPLPFSSPNTPEALLSRSDSKDPARTCRAQTQAGRRCRRPLGPPERRVSAPGGPEDLSLLYCFQHKYLAMDQTLHPARNKNATSSDTLVDELQRLQLEEEKQSCTKASRPARPPPKRQSFWSALCCVGASEDANDRFEVVRHKQRLPSPQSRPPVVQRPPPVKAHSDSTLTKVPSTTPNLMRHIPPNLTPQTVSALLAELSKPLSDKDEPGYIYMFWLTDSVGKEPEEQDAAVLLDAPMKRAPVPQQESTSVLRRFSVHTRGSSNPQALLKIGRANNVHRRMNEWQKQCGKNVTLLRFYPEDTTIPRRRNAFPVTGVNTSTQCSVPKPDGSVCARPLTCKAHNMGAKRGVPGRRALFDTLLAEHQRKRASGQGMPLPAGATPAPSGTAAPARNVRMAHFSHRVERLVHIELAGARVAMGPCEACGRKHREWFSVEARNDALLWVDSVVRRWVSWAEGEAIARGA